MRGRGQRNRFDPGIRPVERIEVPEKVSKFRIVALVVLLAIGLGSLGYGVSRLIAREDGWATIEPLAPSAESVANDLLFFYEFGASGRSVNAEHRELSALYTELCMDAYRIFTVDYLYDDLHNLAYLNEHIGEAVTVDPALYRAFEAMERTDNRFLFAAPFYREYRNLLSDTEDASAATFDPYKDPTVAAYFSELSVFTRSAEHICLQLHGNDTVTLAVSDAYRAFAAANSIDTFVDFYWAQNAFALDYVADELIRQGYTYGNISSTDGFMRVLDGRTTPYSYNLYDVRAASEQGRESLLHVAQMTYSGRTALVSLRSFQMNEYEDIYYTYRTGERRHPYVDVQDGLCKNTQLSLTAYARDGRSSDVLLSMMPAYIADTWDSTGPARLAEEGIYTLYVADSTVYYTDPHVQLGSFYQDGTVTYAPSGPTAD